MSFLLILCHVHALLCHVYALLCHVYALLCHSRVGGNLLDPRFHEDDNAGFSRGWHLGHRAYLLCPSCVFLISFPQSIISFPRISCVIPAHLLCHSRNPSCHSGVGGNLLDPRFHENEDVLVCALICVACRKMRAVSWIMINDLSWITFATYLNF